jgi:hypothetical protein
MSDAAIRSALQTLLYTVSGFPDASHRALENVAYQPAPTESWARIALIFGTEQLGSIPSASALLWREGFLSVGLDVPLESGIATVDTLAQSIRDTFALDTKITVLGRSLTIRRFQRWPGVRDKNRWHVLVDIGWRYQAVNALP